VLHDFSAIKDAQISLTYDVRLPSPSGFNAQAIQLRDDVWTVWEACMQQADAVLLIAPETGGVLARLTKMAEGLKKTVLGCDSSAVQIASDKYQTYQQLKQHGIPAIATYLFQDFPKNARGSWVAKPIDGAGCTDTAVFGDAFQLTDWMQGREQTHIVQPLQRGIAASMSMLCKEGKAYLLACNRQKITMQAYETGSCAIGYEGSVLNALFQYQQAFDRLAQSIAQAIPGLSGYLGVDLVVDGDDIYVVEINPRLTTSYVALRQACGVNPARMLLDLFYNERFEMPAIAHHIVDISLDVER
jgi:predicted ATP-grasp superfamily ATP-dependent carboligase